VADGIEFPNGMVVTPDNSTLIVSESFAGKLTAFDIAADGGLSNRRVWAEGLAPDGICVDAEGAVWTSTGANDCVRVGEGGEILQRIELDRSPFACMLGGMDRTTLFLLAVEWRTQESVPDNLFRLTNGPHTGQVLAAPAPPPAPAGRSKRAAGVCSAARMGAGRTTRTPTAGGDHRPLCCGRAPYRGNYTGIARKPVQSVVTRSGRLRVVFGQLSGPRGNSDGLSGSERPSTGPPRPALRYL
jgi:SMP-30/Gluconolactonase/LRE-like region